MKSLIATSVIVAALSIAVHAAGHDDVVPPLVPENLEVAAGNVPYLVGHASGTQNYVCVPSGGSVAWTLFGPQATLFDDNAGQIITHFLSANPIESGTLRATWQHSRDTSAVWAMATPATTSTDSNYVAPGAIPWLKLAVVGAQYGPAWGDKLIATTFIQRVNTAGGVAPATGCATATDVGKKIFVPYGADYFFYRAKK